MKLTIRDIARAAGVSPATVSRALRDFDNVDPQTKSRIVAIAREMNFAVSPTAVRLATGRTGTIGIVTPFVGSWYFSEIFAGIEEGLRTHDVDLLLHKTGDSSAEPDAHVRMRHRVDGMLIIGLAPDGADVAALRAMDVPAVLVGAQAPGLSSVAIDDVAAARTAVEHLVETGHEGAVALSLAWAGEARCSVGVAWSEAGREVIEGHSHSIMSRDVSGDGVVAAAKVLHEGVPGRDGSS